MVDGPAICPPRSTLSTLAALPVFAFDSPVGSPLAALMSGFFSAAGIRQSSLHNAWSRSSRVGAHSLARCGAECRCGGVGTGFQVGSRSTTIATGEPAVLSGPLAHRSAGGGGVACAQDPKAQQRLPHLPVQTAPPASRARAAGTILNWTNSPEWKGFGDNRC